ncbi:MAG TPA: endo-alpha-N-acetylgalactosaminidase family protein, partial [Puia sp.]
MNPKISVTGLFFVIFSSILFGQQKVNLPPIILKSQDLRVMINRENGLPFQYFYKESKIRGIQSDSLLHAVVCELNPRAYFTLSLKPFTATVKANQADLFFKASYNGLPAASFHLKYLLDASTLFITLERVTEFKGFELIETSLPSLAAVWEEDGPGWMANAVDGGSVVNLKNALACHLPEDNNFGTIGYVLPVAIVGTDKAECIMEISAFMDGILMGIDGRDRHHKASIGTIQAYRVHGGRSYEMNDGGPRVNGNLNTPNLIVGQMSRCRLDFIGDNDGNGLVDWLDGAKLVAKRMPSIPTRYFNDKFVYLVGGKYKLEKEPRTTFAQSEKLIHDIAMLSDYAPQLPLISGWANEGQDTGFPSEDSVNATLGGYHGLMSLMNAGKKYNAHVSINTNYDDAYKSSTVFDTSYI